MFHYRTGLKDYTVNPDLVPDDKHPATFPLYLPNKNNSAFKFFGIHILDKVHKMQNMQGILEQQRRRHDVGKICRCGCGRMRENWPIQ